MHDKFKTCKDCPDRCVDPKCHDKCEGYKYRCEKNAKVKAERKKDCEFNAMKIEVIESSMKKAKTGALKNHLRSKR